MIPSSLEQVKTTLPGPRGLPILGQGFRYQKDPLGFFLWLRENYGDLVSDSNSSLKLAYIYSPDAIEQVLVKNAGNYQKDRILKSWDLIFGEGLLLTEGKKWKQDRQVINPAFSRGRIAQYQDTMLKQASLCTQELAFRLSEKNPKIGARIEITELMTELTLRVALESLFGRSSLSELDERTLQEIKSAMKDIGDWLEFSSGAWLAFIFLLPWFPLPKRRRYIRAVGQLDHVLDRMITRKRREITEGTLKGADLLASLIQATDPSHPASTSAPFTNQDVRDHALTFFLAGHETTSLALTYTLRLLAEYTEIQDQLREELIRRGNPTQIQELEAIEFLSQVIDESLRLFPPASVLAREAAQDDLLLGYRIPKGMTIIVPTWAIHRDPRFYGADAEAFRPDRWTPALRKALPRSVYLPFGFGPRMCIGFGFAIQELKIILSHLLTSYRFTLPQGGATPLRLRPSITLKPKDPVVLEVSPIPRN